jgi:hypothetical protein
MAINVIVNGVTYSVPQTNEELWGNEVTNLLVSLSTNLLQKTGGLFTLSSEADFGPSAGIKSLYYKTRATNISTVGVLRMGSTDIIAWRNTANSGNLLLGVNGSDQLTYNGSPLLTPSSTVARSQIAAGTPNHVVINDGAGLLSSEATLAKSRGGSGQDNSSITFPASGVLVTESGTQTLSNKTFSNEITLAEIASPATPASGFGKIYFKSDGFLYQKNDDGTETRVGSGSSSSNYITNSDFESNATGWVTYADAAGPVPVNGVGGSPVSTFVRSTSSPLRGTASGLLSKDAANRQGEGVAYDFSIAPLDQSKILNISFGFNGSSNLVTGEDSDIRVFIYDVTNSVVIEPNVINIDGSSANNWYYSGQFQTAPNSTSYRLILHIATTSALAYTLKLDDVKVEPLVPSVNSGVIVAKAEGNGVTDQSIPDSTDTPLTQMSVIYDTYGALQINPNLTFTAPERGLYAIQTSFLWNNNTTTATFWSRIYVNSVLTYDDLDAKQSTSNVLFKPNSNFLVQLEAGDVVQLNVRQATGGALLLLTGTFGGITNVQIYKVDGPNGIAGSSNSVIAAAYELTAGTTTPNIPFSTASLIDFNNKIYDTASAVTTGGGWQFVAPKSGYYRASCSIDIGPDTTSLGERFTISGQVNGVEYQSIDTTWAQATNVIRMRATGSLEVKLNAGDSFAITAFQNRSGGTASIAFGVLYISEIASPSPALNPNAKVYVRAEANTGSVPDVTATQVNYNVVVKDNFNSVSTGPFVFTAPKSGQYQVISTVSFLVGSGGPSVNSTLELQLNGSSYSINTGTTFANNGAYRVIQHADIIDMVANDTLTVVVAQDSGATRNLGTASGVRSYITIKEL